jgi:thiol-disulfide isomerase/thioredoxin
MRKLTNIVVICMAVLLITAVGNAAEEMSGKSKTVEAVYQNLTSGVLTFAKLGELPDGILLRADGIEIGTEDINKAIAEQPTQFHQQLKKNAFFVLEQEAAKKLLPKMAKQELGKQNNDIVLTSDNQVLNIFFGTITKDINVSEQDIEKFYKENESIFCNTPLNSVRKQIESYVLQDKKQQFVDRYVQTLGQKIEILVSDAWTKKQAESAKNNPLDKARATGKVTLAVFSAVSCCGPDKMLPVIGTVRGKYSDSINIVYIEPQKEQILAARYNVRSIPTQIFYSKSGQEVFRHSGFFSQEDIEKKLTEMGVK